MRLSLAFLLFVFGPVALSQIDTKRSEPIQVDLTNSYENQIEITWISPETSDISDGEQVTIRIGFKSSASLNNIEILINGQPVERTRGLGIRKASESNFDEILEQPINLKQGRNEVKILAENTNNEFGASEKVFIYDYDALVATGSKNRRDIALIFAIDNYDEWNRLVNPVNDGNTIASELRENYGFETEVITDATTDQILLKLREYAERSYLPDDQLFIFFAGHGQFDESFREGYLVGKNSKINDLAKSSYISHSVLRSIIDRINCEHILLAMDVCFGGTFDPSIATSRYRGGEMYSDVDRTEFIERKLRYKTRRYLTSGGKEYVPDGRAGHHSPFTRRFLDALRDYGGADQILTLGELTSYVEKVSPEPKFGEFGNNEPGSDFIFVARK